MSEHLGIDVDVSILEANDFLMAQIGVLMKILEDNEVKLKLKDEQRRELAELGAKLDPAKRDQYSMLVTGETILTWHRRLVGKILESKKGERKGAPPISDAERELIIRMARENPNWGLLRISGELKKSKINRCATTVRNVLRKEGIEPPPLKCRPNGRWARFMKHHTQVWQTDFAIQPVLNIFTGGVTCYYIQLFINTHSRELVLGGITSSPHTEWMQQSARNISGFEMESADLLIRDNDKIYQPSFDAVFESGGTKVATTCIAAPDMNSMAERVIRSLKGECLSQLMLFSKKQLELAVREYVQFYNTQRPHQGLDNEIPIAPEMGNGEIFCKERLGGLLKSYERLVA